MKFLTYTLFVIIIKAASKVEEPMTTTCTVTMSEHEKKEGQTESIVDVNVECVGKAGEKEVKKSKSKTCTGNDNFLFTTFKRTNKLDEETPDLKDDGLKKDLKNFENQGGKVTSDNNTENGIT